MQGLTKRQEMVLDYITQSIHDRGYPPTLREIGSHMGIRSTNGVNDHLRALERKGYLKREDMKSRALRPVNTDPNKTGELVQIPIVGRVAAGEPVLAEQNIEDTVSIDRYFIGNHQEVFALKVKGDSMIEAGIMDGDTVIIEFRETANDGDIVVALIDEAETTLKRFKRSHRGRYIKLIPANKDMKEMVYEADRVRIQGVLVGQLRKY